MANPTKPATATATATAATVRNANHVLLLKVPAGYKASGARAAWLAAVAAHNGKTVAQFTAAVTANPPSTPTKGKLAGKLEPVPGWLNYFAGNKGGNILTLVAPKA